MAISKVQKIIRYLPIIFIPGGIFLLRHLPTTEIAGLALALVATLMPLAWDPSGDWVRSVWIATVFLFVFVAYRAINKESQDREDHQAQLLKDEHDSFQRILDQGQTNYTNAVAQERSDFDRMIGRIVEAQKEENKQFAALLNKEDDLFTRQEQLAEGLNGKLFPASDPTPRNSCGVLIPNTVLIMLGDNAFPVTQFPHTVILSRSQGPVISVDHSDDGSIAILMDIKDKDHKIIARMNRDGFVINRSNYLEMKKDKSSLLLIDEYGTEVLNAHYMNAHAFALSGELFQFPNIHNSCFRGGRADIEIP